jgi:hypothetical protein
MVGRELHHIPLVSIGKRAFNSGHKTSPHHYGIGTSSHYAQETTGITDPSSDDQRNLYMMRCQNNSCHGGKLSHVFVSNTLQTDNSHCVCSLTLSMQGMLDRSRFVDPLPSRLFDSLAILVSVVHGGLDYLDPFIKDYLQHLVDAWAVAYTYIYSEGFVGCITAPSNVFAQPLWCSRGGGRQGAMSTRIGSSRSESPVSEPAQGTLQNRIFAA